VTNVAVLAGGSSPEREVSLRSGHRVVSALNSRDISARLVDPAEAPLVGVLAEGGFDACYLTLHGKEGEDGTVQRLLELVGLPYTGTEPLACEIAFDKMLAKDALSAAGVRTPAWATVQTSALRDLGAGAALDRVVESVGLPAVVKPSRSGSAMGVRFVERATDLPGAVMGALSFSDGAIVERKVEGTEVTVGIVANEPLPVVEIVPKSGVFDYAARYTAGATEYFAPARIAQDVADACTAEGLRTFETLALRDVARVDAMIDAGGTTWILEANLSPGMTETSLLPMAASAAGISLDDLCDRVLQAALARS
jgi:D-alanine-D-alanine ligase